MVIGRLAIVNRGATAVRLLHAAREHALLHGRDLQVVAVHREAERDSLFVREADESISIGDAPLTDLVAVEAALRRAGTDAAWVGWGALAQSAEFADLCTSLGILAVGPDGETLRTIARPEVLADLASAAGLPLAPPDVVAQGYERHLEVLVIADRRGTSWAVGVHDGTLQRRTEKVLVETATPNLTGVDHAALVAAAARITTLAGFVGTGTVTFVRRAGAGGVALLRVSAGLPLGHGVTEIATGLDLAKLQLHVAEGERLIGQPPPPDGHAIAVRLNAEDAAHGFAPAPGTVALLQLPSGPGLRVDAGIVEGDEVDATVDPTLAEIVAWGRDREEARVRLHRALATFPVVLDGGTTNKGFLLDLLDRPEVLAGRYDTAWLDRLAAGGGTDVDRLGDVAVLVAAVDAYDTEQAVDRAHLFASARRGRPDVRADVGRAIDLVHRGHEYRVTVRRTGRRRYRAAVDGRTVDLLVTRLGRHQSRFEVGTTGHRVVSDVQSGDHLVEVDGVPHRLSRADGGVVRAPMPGVVVAVSVAPGDLVEAGSAVAVLESMKMESTVEAPFAGRVRQVLVGTNVQVDQGAALVRLEPPAPTAAVAAPRLVFAAADVAAPGGVEEQCRRNLDTLRRLVMGYDIDVSEARRVASEQHDLCAAMASPTAEVLDGELALLSVFADLRALFRAQRDAAEADVEVRSAQEHLHAYLRSVDAEGEGLSLRFLADLRRALEHYGVRGLAHTAALEDALYWIMQSRQREDAQIPVVVEVLQRWLSQGIDLGDATAERVRSTLDRLITTTQRNRPVVADLAREARFRLFDEPVLSATRARVYDEMQTHLHALVADPKRPDRDRHVNALVDCPQPLVPMLLDWAATATSDERATALEVITRRYHRLAEPRSFRLHPGPVPVLTAIHDDEQHHRVHLVTACAAPAELDVAEKAMAGVVAALPASEAIELELASWLPPGDDADRLSERIAAVLRRVGDDRRVNHAVVALAQPGRREHISSVRHLTLRPDASGALAEDLSLHGLHPMMARRLRLWRLSRFELERLPSAEDVYLFRGVARENPKDERLFAVAEVRDLSPVVEDGRVVALPQLERALADALEAIRRFQAPLAPSKRLPWNRITLAVWPPLDVPIADIEEIARRLAPVTLGLGIEEVVVDCRRTDRRSSHPRPRALHLANPAGTGFVITETDPPTEPLAPLDEYTQKVVQSRRRGTVYPYELLRSLTAPHAGGRPEVTGGDFVEHDLDADGALVPVTRPPGRNTASIVAGVVRNTTDRYPEGMARVVLLGDPTRALGALAEAECRRIIAGLDLAETLGIPLEWFALSAGARIAMDSGTENMDWISAVLRRIIEFTQAGGEINVVVTGINVGAQPYWNAEATMLMHTKGILVMTPDSAMVLTGKQALDFSGSVSAEDNHGIGGYERIMGPNGQAQYWAPDLDAAIGVLLAHYAHAYVAPGERFPRRAVTADRPDRDVRPSPHRLAGSELRTVGDVLSDATNPGRKQPFDMRSVMRAVIDEDHEPLERWLHLRDGDTVAVWDAHLGGWPVCMIGIEGHALPRRGPLAADGPDLWTSGTFFPMSSKKTARAINAATGNRPVVVMANLSGFDGSPESMRRLQLEFGAEIGRAVVNFRGPIVFCVVSRFHGGAFVVFSRRLNEALETIAVEGSHASVIGGAPAAAVVFSGDVDNRTREDPRVKGAEAEVAAAEPSARPALRARLAALMASVRSEKLGEVAAEFDSVHSVERALRVGSVDRIIPAVELRPRLVEAVERGIARELTRLGQQQ
jgi:acetyl/propionyl-CoA carboxylase alpha subunit/acetyl-CoA carboxylase carboxyltransferase component